MNFQKISYSKIIAIKIKTGQNIIIIGAIYRSPYTCKEKYVENLNSFLLRFTKNSKQDYVIVGYIYIDILSDCVISNKYLNTFAVYGYLPAVTIPTRVQENSATCIDHYFIKSTNSTEKITVFVLEDIVTDHYPIFLKLKYNINNNKQKFTNRQKLSFSILYSMTAKQDWSKIYETKDVDIG